MPASSVRTPCSSATSARDDLIAFAQRTLGPLLDHDRAHAGELVATLRAYLDEDRVQRRVAARCFIHVNTVVYRVHRIEELLGADLGDPKTVFDLTLALRIMDLLADDPTRSVAAGPDLLRKVVPAHSRRPTSPAVNTTFRRPCLSDTRRSMPLSTPSWYWLPG